MKYRQIKFAGIFTNPHVWVLVVLVTGLAFVYYYGKTNFYQISVPWFRNLIYYEYVNDLNGSLFFIPFLYAAIVFWWRGTLATLLISEIVMLPYVHYMAANTESFVRNIMYPFIPILILGFISIELKWREGERKNLAEREAERQSYTLQIFKAQEDERRRISQELHDDTLQMLYIIANHSRDLALSVDRKNTAYVETEAEWIHRSIFDVAEEVRRISIDLRPSILDDLSLVPAIRWLIDRLNQESGPKIQMNVFGSEWKMSVEVDVMIYRIIQEALNNARKHARATKIWVTLEFKPDDFKIEVRDNGTGFSFPERINSLVAEGKLGLIGIQQRANFIGGVLNVQSEPGNGTTLCVDVKGQQRANNQIINHKLETELKIKNKS